MENNFEFNRLYKPVFTTKARYIDCCGGRAAGRLHFGTDYFLFLITQPEYFRGCFLRNVFGDIRDSLFQDFKDRLESSDFDENDFEVNESKMSVLYKPTGNGIISKGFKKSSGNRSAKLKSLAGITHVLIEEADENTEDDFNKLDDSIRTNKIENIQIILLHNPPPRNHWIVKRFYNLVESGINGYYKPLAKNNPDVVCIFSNYKDNIKNLNQKTISKYENYGDSESPFYNEEYYYVDVKGLIPEGARGRIYKGWKHITIQFFKSLPYPSYYGLDFGYSDDPVALVEIKSHNNRNFFREIVYEAGLTNPALVHLMKARGVPETAIIYADSAEPKSIQELKNLGYRRTLPADKEPDSLLFGIKQIKAMENFATEDSKNLWNENEEYKWHLDSEDMPTNQPVDRYNHLKDALRYGVTTHKKKSKGIIIGSARADEEDAASLFGFGSNPLDWI